MGHKEYIGSDGEVWPSVTTVLAYPPKPWLEAWKLKWGKRAEQKLQAANNVGNEFHKYAEAVANYGQFAIPETKRLGKMTMQFLMWVKEYGFVPVETELHVVSEMYHYSGTFDAVGYFKAKPKTLVLCDWKTSSGIYPDMALQLSAYAQAYKEQTGKQIKTGYIVHVSKDKPHHKLTVKRYTLGKRLFAKFLKRLNQYREKNSEC